MNKSTSVTGLTRTVNFDSNNEGGIDVRMTQVRCVSVDCTMRGNSVVKVVAVDGITFKAACGMTLELPAGASITHLCDLPFMARQIAEEDEERMSDAQMRVKENAAAYGGNPALYPVGVREFVG